jgi:uncharacterized membrane protein YbhN (UPF0104 family)
LCSSISELARVTADSGLVGDIRTLAILGAAGFLLAVLAFLLMAVFQRQADQAVGWLAQRLLPRSWREPGLGLARRFLSGLASLRSGRDTLMVLGTSVVIWLFETLILAGDARLSLRVASSLMLMNGIVNLATTIPSAPGYLGTFDAPGIAVLVAFGVERATAAGYTLVLHAALWLPITVLGAYYMARESLSWREIREQVSAEAEA